MRRRFGGEVRRAWRVSALVCFVTKKLLRFWQYARQELRISSGRNPAQTNEG